ncbi:hypothetical protein IWQ60_007587 [Tieghemiomyces parasiticus]|uniref:COP9 signalosome complex subunit 3 N-terminal helical repeats domain-containing protein n=1 Tax=Tieghemiomyces parasiticus TaxID=78921 RepID=A0A9W7ZXC5_9FUNG|nr:hypothetical protein IWQ60_007587 [Tieghemiomyces parasiticus]
MPSPSSDRATVPKTIGPYESFEECLAAITLTDPVETTQDQLATLLSMVGTLDPLARTVNLNLAHRLAVTLEDLYFEDHQPPAVASTNVPAVEPRSSRLGGLRSKSKARKAGLRRPVPAVHQYPVPVLFALGHAVLLRAAFDEITPLHSVTVQIGLARADTATYNLLLPLLEGDLIRVQPHISGVTIDQYLWYHYDGAAVYLATGRYAEAYTFLYICLAMPTEGSSHPIQRLAFHRFLLLRGILFAGHEGPHCGGLRHSRESKPTHLPRFVSSEVQAMASDVSPAYLDIVRLCRDLNSSGAREALTRHLDHFIKDGNYELAEAAVSAIESHLIYQVAQTYDRIPLRTMAELLHHPPSPPTPGATAVSADTTWSPDDEVARQVVSALHRLQQTQGPQQPLSFHLEPATDTPTLDTVVVFTTNTRAVDGTETQEYLASKRERITELTRQIQEMDAALRAMSAVSKSGKRPRETSRRSEKGDTRSAGLVVDNDSSDGAEVIYMESSDED